MTGIVFVYVTHPEAEGAAALGRGLVEEGLAACVNVLPGMRAIYRWQDRIEEGAEAVMILKTTADLVAPLRKRISAEHPYECPCVACIEVTDGDPEYLAWIGRSCGARA